VQGFRAAADIFAAHGFRDFQNIAVVTQDITARDGLCDAENG